MNTKNKYCAIILAAGKSSRFGQNKFLFEIEGQALLKHTLTPFISLRELIPSIFVITGAYTQELTPLLKEQNVTQIHNSLYHIGGMSQSIKTGLFAIQNSLDEFNGIIIHPGDIPFIKETDIKSMIYQLENTDKLIIIPIYKGQKGHPLLVEVQLFDELSALNDENKGLHGFLKNHLDLIGYVSSNNKGILQDIDFHKDIS